MQLIRRFASGAVLAEELEARLVRGEQVDIAEHALLSSTLVRLAQRIEMTAWHRRCRRLSVITCAIHPPLRRRLNDALPLACRSDRVYRAGAVRS